MKRMNDLRPLPGDDSPFLYDPRFDDIDYMNMVCLLRCFCLFSCECVSVYGLLFVCVRFFTAKYQNLRWADRCSTTSWRTPSSMVLFLSVNQRHIHTHLVLFLLCRAFNTHESESSIGVFVCGPNRFVVFAVHVT